MALARVSQGAMEQALAAKRAQPAHSEGPSSMQPEGARDGPSSMLEGVRPQMREGGVRLC